ncbi:hypothetical protein [Streptacidiphilus sp. MAP5-3]|uniref:hypothetical protein n=1 Tax=unclassified Streptacidiphilus TaxID=2643834 RepID=UPI00351830FD
MTDISADRVKVHFRMDVDEDGCPPVSVESLWAVDLGDGTMRLDNTPLGPNAALWFVCGCALLSAATLRLGLGNRPPRQADGTSAGAPLGGAWWGSRRRHCSRQRR